jgi:hypothetical protein
MKFICNFFQSEFGTDDDGSRVGFVSNGRNYDEIMCGLNSGKYLIGGPAPFGSSKTVSELVDQGVIGIYQPNLVEKLIGKNPPQ